MAGRTSQVAIDQITNVHFIGIGGIGMSSLARHFVFEKKAVSGSDRELTDLTKALASEGVKVMSPQSPDNILADVELVGDFTRASGCIFLQ